MTRRGSVKSARALVLLFAVSAYAVFADEPLVLQIDFGQPAGMFRPLHGINKGPLVAGGRLDLSAFHRAIAVPFVRLHDCHWPNPDVVDIHVVFPDFRADPERAESYDFARTDEYLSAIRRTGAQIVYRLGESIEHTPTKRFVHPPPDDGKWAAICLGIIRHYNDGWARGFHHNIRYWEIWNEPENRPQMWTGTDEEYFDLYKTAAQIIKAKYPQLKVGGPALGDTGGFENGEFNPSAFLTNFLDFCRRKNAPLDFFSWHCYTDDPGRLTVLAREMRRQLDARGFMKTESHFNEWNFLPHNDWTAMLSPDEQMRRRWYEEMSGASGAAFVATALLELQDAPVDVSNFYHGEVGGFGLFTEQGAPTKNYLAVRAFRSLLETPHRVGIRGAVAGKLAIGAGLDADKRTASMLISNFAAPQSEARLVLRNFPWRGATVSEVRMVDATRNFEMVRSETNSAAPGAIVLNVKSPAVVFVTLRRR